MARNTKKSGGGDSAEGMPIGEIPKILTGITPDMIDSSSPIKGGFGSWEREVIAQAAVLCFQQKGSWNWVITRGSLRAALAGLGRKNLANPGCNLESQFPFFDGSCCLGVGDGLLLQKVAENAYCATELFIDTCHDNSPKAK